jgi:hypothetical protein
MAYSQSQSLKQLKLKIDMHTHSFDLYLHLSQLILYQRQWCAVGFVDAMLIKLGFPRTVID